MGAGISSELNHSNQHNKIVMKKCEPNHSIPYKQSALRSKLLMNYKYNDLVFMLLIYILLYYAAYIVILFQIKKNDNNTFKFE